MSYVYIYLFALCSMPLIIDGADFPVLYSSSLIPLTATPLIQTFTSHPGYDGHTRYPDGNYTQDWYITTNWINHTIKINFATCFIENLKGACLFDYLYVYDGANASSPEMMKSCCGKTHSATLESSTGEMYILFETDNMLGDTGFEIEYWSNGITTTTTTTTVASSTALYSSSLIPLTATPLIQTFTSHPGYDGHTSYPDGNYTQDWYITTNWINHTIKINFATCFIENDHGVCLFDYLYVFDGANSSCPKMIKTCCGRVHSATLESSTGEMYIMFATDNTIGDTGFEIEYWSNGITTTTTTTTVAPSTALYSSSLISLTATPLIQTFTSHPGYDGHTPYPDGNYTQDWYITTNWINHTIKINIATCFMENAKGVCLFDLLYVFDGANASSPKMIQTCCGSFMYNTSATSESSTGEMYILFETDNTVGDSGFEIEYWSNGITTTTTTTVASSTEPTTDSVRWNMTSFPERHDVSCLSDSISVFIPSDLLSHYYSTWRDPHCQVQDNGTHYVSTISHTSCGTTVIFTKDEVIFENELILHKSGSSSNQALTNSSIDFDSPNSEVIPVQCIYPRRQNITTLYRPAQSRVRFYEKRYGHMDVQLEQYKTGKFVTPLPVRSFPNEVEINKDMYFILHAMHVNSTDVAVKVDSCVATPSIMPADGRIYQLLDHGCPASPAVKVYPSSFDEVRFSVRAFEFRTSPGGIVYIHCQVSVCSPTSPQCVTGCSHRHRRDVSREDGGSHLVSGGPYLLVADKGGLQVSTVVAGVCASVAVVATVMAIIGWKRKSSASTSGSTF